MLHAPNSSGYTRFQRVSRGILPPSFHEIAVQFAAVAKRGTGSLPVSAGKNGRAASSPLVFREELEEDISSVVLAFSASAVHSVKFLRGY